VTGASAYSCFVVTVALPSQLQNRSLPAHLDVVGRRSSEVKEVHGERRLVCCWKVYLNPCLRLQCPAL
ncbi:hypothetical protein NDU88_007678, partial [Pleurodeles waltl]